VLAQVQKQARRKPAGAAWRWCRRTGLLLDHALELFAQPFDRIGGAPLGWRQTAEGAEPVARLLKAVGNGTVLEPPLANERRVSELDQIETDFANSDHSVINLHS
jgi:hypothetical protein